MKKINPRYVILTSLILIVIILSFISYASKSNRKLSPIESFLKDGILLTQKIITAPINLVSDTIKDYNEKQDSYQKYIALKEKEDQYKYQEAKLNEQQTQINKLNELLDLEKTLSQYTYQHAQVLNRNLNYWNNEITIDKGSSNGIEIDMAVITKNGLIGKVIDTSTFTSKVRLLTSSDISNKVSVKIITKEEVIYGILSSYDQKNGLFLVEGISGNKKIDKLSTVVTTGMGIIFPSGILIGQVETYELDNFGLAYIVKVNPSVNYDDLTHVTILKREK
jgi:rod shape-determining protein MreC